MLCPGVELTTLDSGPASLDSKVDRMQNFVLCKNKQSIKKIEANVCYTRASKVELTTLDSGPASLGSKIARPTAELYIYVIQAQTIFSIFDRLPLAELGSGALSFAGNTEGYCGGRAWHGRAAAGDWVAHGRADLPQGIL